jgi:pyrroloquinoline quinone biosynthesis protein D
VTDVTLSHPALAQGVRLHWDEVRQRHVLLFPEGALTLNETAADVLELCDGQRSLDEIAELLGARYSGADVRDDVAQLVGAIADRGLVIDADA